jgi:hypothetical protein
MPITAGRRWHGATMSAVQHEDLQVLASVMYSPWLSGVVPHNTQLSMHGAAETLRTRRGA